MNYETVVEETEAAEEETTETTTEAEDTTTSSSTLPVTGGDGNDFMWLGTNMILVGLILIIRKLIKR